MYYQPKPIRSQRLHLTPDNQLDRWLKKLGRVFMMLILVLATAQLFALLEKPAGPHNQQAQTPVTSPALADSYLQ
jgi:phosphotransferase system  glucose/maltose/N-acetylglucosamine-specific IIC component